jgi:hypothetical protein
VIEQGRIWLSAYFSFFMRSLRAVSLFFFFFKCTFRFHSISFYCFSCPVCCVVESLLPFFQDGFNVVYICVPTVSKAPKSSKKGLSNPGYFGQI